jgi:hypothetical protein
VEVNKAIRIDKRKKENIFFIDIVYLKIINLVQIDKLIYKIYNIVMNVVNGILLGLLGIFGIIHTPQLTPSPMPKPTAPFERVLTITITQSPTKTPVPTKYIPRLQPTIDTDPQVNCLIDSRCGGGTRNLKKSACSNSTCCQIGNTWLFYENKNQCITDQNKYYQDNKPPNTIPTWAPPPTFAPFITWTPYPTQAFPTYAAIPTRDPACDSINNEWNDFKRNFMANQYNNYSSSFEAIQALNGYRTQYQNTANSHNCNIYLSL